MHRAEEQIDFIIEKIEDERELTLEEEKAIQAWVESTKTAGFGPGGDDRMLRYIHACNQPTMEQFAKAVGIELSDTPD